MSRRLEIAQLQSTLKSLMATQKRTLADLARQLDVSIPTAKRVLNQDDLSLERILQICDWLGVKFRELVEIAEQERAAFHYCSEAQEVFLATRLSHFALLRSLQKGDSLEQIISDNGLTPDDVQKYLQDLEREGFLGRRNDGAIDLQVKDGMNWREDGPLHKAFLGRWINDTAAHFATASQWVDSVMLDIGQRRYTKETFQHMKKEIDDLSRKYASLSRLERHLRKSEELEFYTVAVLGDRWVAPMWRVKPYGKG